MDLLSLSAFSLSLCLPVQDYRVKSNDLYDFFQSDDLADSGEPHVTRLRQTIYSAAFLELVTAITGVELNSTVDMSAAIYRKGSYLACHDDELDARRIAYILYMVRRTLRPARASTDRSRALAAAGTHPHRGREGGREDRGKAAGRLPPRQVVGARSPFRLDWVPTVASFLLCGCCFVLAGSSWQVPEDWEAADGGALDLFDMVGSHPDRVVHSLVPQWNSFAMFEVTTESYHRVAEVLSQVSERVRRHG